MYPETFRNNDHGRGEDSVELAGVLPSSARTSAASQENRHGENRQRLRGCHPPREIVIATRTTPRVTIARPMPEWTMAGLAAKRISSQKQHHNGNSILRLATPPSSRIKTNGIATGKVVSTTIRNTPIAPSQSSF